MRFRRPFASLLALFALTGLASCGGDVTLPNEGEPAHVAVVQGDGKTGVAGTPLGDSVVVRVTDSQDRPVVDVPVSFVVVGGAGSASPATVRTNADGRAATQWTLGGATGAQRLQARVTAPAGTLSADVTATAGTGTATTLALVSGDAQSAVAGSMLPDSLVVRATDAKGNAVAGVAVAWAAAGGGSVSAAATLTGADGRTGVTRTLGTTAGPQTATATSEGLAGSPVTFAATAQVGQAGQLRIETEPPTTAVSGVAFSTAPKVRLLDANGNPLGTSGVAVTATIASGPSGAQLVGTDTRGTSSGVATFTGLGIQGPAGDYTINFGGDGLTGATSRIVTIGGGVATKLQIVTQPSSSAQSGVAFPAQPRVRLVDASGNPVGPQGTVTVTATLVGGAGTLNGDRTKDVAADGVATFTDLGITGPTGNYTILFAAPNLTSVSSAPVGVGLGPSSTSIGTISPEPSVTGQSYTVAVAVSGSGNTPTGSVAVSDGAGATCTATLSGGAGNCSLRSTSAGARTISAGYGGDAQHGGSGDTKGHTVDKAATTTAIGSISPSSGLPGASVRVDYAVAVASPGTGTPTGTVVVSGGSDSCSGTVADGGCSLQPTTVGAVTFTAAYAGDASFAGSSDTKGGYTVLAPPVPDLTVQKSHAGNFTRGSTGDYSIVVGNVGTGATSGTITLTDALPAGLSAASVAATPSWSCSLGGTVTCTRTNPIAAGGSSTITLTVNVAAAAASSVTNGASVAGGGESNTANDTDSDPTTIVSPPNQAPVAVGEAYATNEDQALSVSPGQGVLKNDTDTDGPQALAASVVSGPSHGTLTLNADGSFTYAPAANYNGPDGFTYSASDGQASSQASVTITVQPVNDAPVAVDDNAGDTPQNTPLTIDVLANDSDVDGDALTPVVASDPANGTVTVNGDGTITYTPNQDYTGPDAFTYRASDGNATSAPATVTLGVQ